MRILIVATLIFGAGLAGCTPDRYYEDSSMYGEVRTPVRTEGTVDSVFERIDEQAGG